MTPDINSMREEAFRLALTDLPAAMNKANAIEDLIARSKTKGKVIETAVWEQTDSLLCSKLSKRQTKDSS